MTNTNNKNKATNNQQRQQDSRQRRGSVWTGQKGVHYVAGYRDLPQILRGNLGGFHPAVLITNFEIS